MAVVTFLSDFGTKDHYVAAVKASILAINPGIQVIDLSHSINSFDISHAAYVLSNSFRLFQKGTVHLIAVNSTENVKSKILAVKLEDHYFVGSDSGIFSLISKQSPAAIVEIAKLDTTFVAKDILGPTAARIASGNDVYNMGNRIDGITKLFKREPKVTKKEIVGNVIHLDHYGNLITNITKMEFDKIIELNGSENFEIQIGREKYQKIHKDFRDTDPGECYILFNSIGNLQIGINQGNASELLGLRFDSPVFIYFQ